MAAILTPAEPVTIEYNAAKENKKGNSTYLTRPQKRIDDSKPIDNETPESSLATTTISAN